MAVETNLRVLVVKLAAASRLVENVAPLVRGIERAVDDGESRTWRTILRSRSHCLSVSLSWRRVQLNGFFGERVEALEFLGDGSLFVVIAFHHGTLEIAHDLKALVRVGIVAHDIAQAHIVRDLVLLGVAMTALSASRLAWMSPKMAKRMSGVGGRRNINLLFGRNIQFFPARCRAILIGSADVHLRPSGRT